MLFAIETRVSPLIIVSVNALSKRNIAMACAEQHTQNQDQC
jgi:hypothetical protein